MLAAGRSDPRLAGESGGCARVAEPDMETHLVEPITNAMNEDNPYVSHRYRKVFK